MASRFMVEVVTGMGKGARIGGWRGTDRCRGVEGLGTLGLLVSESDYYTRHSFPLEPPLS